MVGFLNKTKLCDSYDTIRNLHQIEGGSLSAVFMSYKVVDSSLNGCDIAHAIQRYRSCPVADLIINEGEILLKQCCNDDSSVVGQPVLIIINIDYVSVTVDIVEFFAGKLDNTASGLGTSVSIEQTFSERFRENLPCHIVDHLAHRSVKIWLVNLKIMSFCIKCDTDKTVSAKA